MQTVEVDTDSAWATIFDAVGFGLILIDAQGRVLRWNGWLTRHTGVTAQAACGQSLAEAFGAPLPASFMSALNNALRYKLPVVLSNVLHRGPLPLYVELPASTEADRMPHAITLTPLPVAPWGPCCLIQITDSSRSVSREKVLRRHSDRLNREVMTDSLTRAFSRGFFDQFYQQEFARARRQGSKLALIMVDVDYFKAYNDEYGHPAGDKILVALVQTLKTALMRSTDKLARYGGEEFAVILPDCAKHNAMLIAEHLRSAVQELKLPHRKSGNADQITVSLGVSSTKPGDTCEAADLLDTADQALYAAKRHGRNCVQYLEPSAHLRLP
ncbi:diguanylate cyclase domain-containing protein [Rhodoferax sp.]|uniref:sensor domain-containing diguanylate cyclase n=1 Tax=Rhodoferax sp. TaxID=50421 RepID=UPI002749480C|nr:diguanylate cyclase [Rhodoferax sp.]